MTKQPYINVIELNTYCALSNTLNEMENYENMTRKELQTLAKANGIKANLPTVEIIAKLMEVNAATIVAEKEEIIESPEVVDAELIVTEATHGDKEVEVLFQEKKSIEQEITPTDNRDEREPTVGDEIEAEINGEWKNVTVKRVNKKSIRVCVMEDNTEITVKFTEIRFPNIAMDSTSEQPTEDSTEIREEEISIKNDEKKQ